MARLAALLPYPDGHQVAGDEVVADLLGRELLRVQDEGESFVRAALSTVRAGQFEGVPDGRSKGRVEVSTRGPWSAAIWTSPSSMAVETRWIATLVDPNAVHMWLASCPRR